MGVGIRVRVRVRVGGRGRGRGRGRGGGRGGGRGRGGGGAPAKVDEARTRLGEEELLLAHAARRISMCSLSEDAPPHRGL